MEALEQKVQALAGYPSIGERLARRFGEVIRQQDDWGVFRVNPLSWSELCDVPPQQALDLFVHAARVGLFDFTFNQLCVGCGGVEFSNQTLSETRDNLHCTTCDRDVEQTMDEHIEVAFTVNPAVRPLAIDGYQDPESYARMYFTANRTHSREVQQYVRANARGFVLVQPDAHQDLKLEAALGEEISILSIDIHSRVNLAVVQGGPREVSIGYQTHGPDVGKLEIGPGPVTVRIVNNRGGPVAGFVGAGMSDIGRVSLQYPHVWKPFVTGKMLLNNQAFRDLFRVQTLAPDLKLSLKSLTLLFTDLKGSTELYDRTGDVYAYQVVQEHFRALANAVRRHSGAIVKTMGDAIMASFSSSRDAVAAAVDMMKAMDAVNAKLKADGHETGLKVGLHEGPALAVNAESRLDYFGQTVNIAARVQALASSGEIWLTEPVLAAEGVSEALKRSGYSNERKVVALKGVGVPTPVFRCVG